MDWSDTLRIGAVSCVFIAVAICIVVGVRSEQRIAPGKYQPAFWIVVGLAALFAALSAGLDQ